MIMSYYFDQATAGSVSIFQLTYSLIPSVGSIKTYSQTVTFTDISSGVWFKTPPP